MMYRFLVHEVGLIPSSEALSSALQIGSIEYLKLLFDPASLDPYGTLHPTVTIPKQHNIPWSMSDLKEAAKQGFADCIACVIDQGCPWYPEVRGKNPGQSQSRRAFARPLMIF
jgi:hypothetical protein